MAAKPTSFCTSLLGLLFNGTAISNLADNAASSPATNLYVSLHTASPGTSGTQATSETNYTGYARVAVARTTGGWTVSSGSVVPASYVVFPVGTAGSGTITHFGVGTASSGAGVLLYYGTVAANFSVGNTIVPVLTPASTISES